MGLLFNQQHAAVAQVQLQEQDACRYVTCPGTQPVGTKLLPEDIIAPPSDLYPHRLWGKPEEVNVRLHVGSDDLNLRSQGQGLGFRVLKIF
jgi:hypothetical protein